MSFYEVTISIADHLRNSLIERLSNPECLGMIEQDSAVIAYYPETAAIDGVLTDLSLFGTLLVNSGEQPDLHIRHCLIPAQDWNETWKKGFVPLDVGERFTILPPWEPKRDNRINLVIDPAMAFGTGHHETTRSCLLLMEKYEASAVKKDFLDIGSGTGILAIAAVKLGWKNVVAIDTDPLAVEATHKNCEDNDAGSLTVLLGSVADLHEEFDFIAANLISGVLIELAPLIAARLKRGGIAVLSGILSGQDDEVVSAAVNAGLRMIERHPDGKWISLVVAR